LFFLPFQHQGLLLFSGGGEGQLFRLFTVAWVQGGAGGAATGGAASVGAASVFAVSAASVFVGSGLRAINYLKLKVKTFIYPNF